MPDNYISLIKTNVASAAKTSCTEQILDLSQKRSWSLRPLSAMMNSTTSTNDSEQAANTSSVRAEIFLGLIIIDFTFGTITTVGNASLFITICRDPCRCLRTPSVFLIANLSVADFFMGIVSYLRAAELTYKYCGLGDLPVLNMTQYFIGAVSILVAVSTLLAMSYDRYIAIIKPFEYPQKITNLNTKVAIAIIWINALFMSILPVSDVKRENFLLAYCYSHFVIPSFILTAVYVKIYKMAALQRQELKGVRANLTAANRRLYLERDKRMVVTSLLILFTFYLSFLPYFINIQILYFCSCRASYAYKVYHYVANEFLSMSSMIDPIMYSWRLPKFNRSLRLCFRRWERRNVVAVWKGTSSNPKTESLKIASEEKVLWHITKGLTPGSLSLVGYSRLPNRLENWRYSAGKILKSQYLPVIFWLNSIFVDPLLKTQDLTGQFPNLENWIFGRPN